MPRRPAPPSLTERLVRRFASPVSRIESAVWLPAFATATALAYAVIFGWTAQKTPGPDGYLHGPYTAREFVQMAAVLGILAVVGGLRGVALHATLAVTASLLVCFAVGAVRDPDNDGLWVIGAVLVAVGSLAGVGLTALTVELLGRRLRRRWSGQSPTTKSLGL